MKKGQLAEGKITHVVFPNKGVAVTEEGEEISFPVEKILIKE